MTIAWTDEDILRMECEDDAAAENLFIVRCAICDGELDEREAVKAGRHSELCHEDCANRRYPDSQGDI